MLYKKIIVSGVAAGALLVGCASDTHSEVEAGVTGGDGVSADDGATVDEGGVAAEDITAVSRATVDATGSEVWAYFDLDTGAIVDVADPAMDGVWDLGFQRFKVITNSGVSGNGGVEAVSMDGADFAALSDAPAGEYEVDTAQEVVEEGGFNSGGVDSAFLGEDDDWYVYNPVGNVLAPEDRVYVVKSTEGVYFKILFEDYYSDAGTPANITFAYEGINPPVAE